MFFFCYDQIGCWEGTQCDGIIKGPGCILPLRKLIILLYIQYVSKGRK